MFCKKCGTQLNDNDKFCYQCGEKIIISTIQNNESIQNGDKIENVENNNENSNANDLIEEGKSLQKNGRYEEAKEYFLKATKLNPNSDIALNCLGYIYKDMEKYNEAVDIFLRAIELDNNNSDNWIGLIYTYIICGEYKKAIDCSLKAIKINKNEYNYWLALGDSYKATFNNIYYEDAIRSYLIL